MLRVLFVLAIALSALLAGFPAQAQPAAKRIPTASEVKKAVEHLASLAGGEGDNPESLGGVAKKVVAYLKVHRPDEGEASKLGLRLAASYNDAARIRVYLFTHNSGGSRGTISNVVLQWQNVAGKLFAYYVPVECGFDAIFPLQTPSRKMYLLVGYERGSGSCVNCSAYVIELKGDYLILDNKVFGDESGLEICNVTMEFDATKQMLSVEADDMFGEQSDGYSDKPFRPTKYVFRQGHFIKIP
ncbi:hypothetical protein [Hymenobacter psychrophilus]|uniref:Uncharacterized protein n=1 Tax=Hymenobacter psychrophilus TaxID=651662 RepID=A0A1H3CVX7_9BACT|nr:hypothetical protein [Hymenobacter psychrophilus]SDX58226.1 hypothetical protein SAMN04488069_102132 [Hymenobacter psychrophilus]